MIAIKFILILLVGHWVADFLFQSRWMAQNKSSNWTALVIHVVIYSKVIFVSTVFAAALLLPSIPIVGCIVHAIVNGIIHFGVDSITSRLSGRFYQQNNLDLFWYTVGFDQLLHTVTLIITFVHIINI